jgi:hypothetical protein
MKTETKNIVFGIIIGIMACFSCFLAICTVCWIQRTFFDYEEHMANMRDFDTGEGTVAILVLDSIPQTAKNIYYAVHLRDQKLKAVFTISRDEFLQWITDNREKWQLEKKTMSVMLQDEMFQCDMQCGAGLIQVKSDFYYIGETSRRTGEILRPETIKIIYDENHELCYLVRARGSIVKGIHPLTENNTANTEQP